MADENILTVALMAALGDAESQVKLGGCYIVGKGVEKDAAKGVEWMQKAADQGNAQAKRVLGKCYISGTGVEKDYDKAIGYLLPFALAGDMSEQSIIAAAYAAKYCDTDALFYYEEAIKWYKKAADQGDEESKTAMIQLALLKALNKKDDDNK